MFKSVDYTAVHNYISGVLLEPRAPSKTENSDATEDIKILDACSLDLTAFKEVPTMAQARWKNGRNSYFSALDELVGVYQGVRESTVTVGRRWHCNLRMFTPSCMEHIEYGSSKLSLVPAVAGMAANEMSAASITAWTQFNVLLGTSGAAGPPDYSVMSAMMRVQSSYANPVRFIHRLAALYHHCVWAEHNQDTFELRLKPMIENIGTPSAVMSNIGRAQVGIQFVPWASYGGLDDDSVLEVLLAASCGSLKASGLKRSRFLRLWPFIGNDVVLLVEDGKKVASYNALRSIQLTSRQVWFAAVRWVKQYSSLVLWDEAIQFVGTVCVSPSTGNPITPASDFIYALPASNMGAYCLGRFTQPLEEGSLGTVAGEPKHAVLVEECIILATLLGLVAWHGAWRVCGWFFTYGKCNRNEASEFWRRYALTKGGAPVWKNHQAQLSLLTKGNVGRIFSTVTYKDMFAFEKLGNWNTRAIQFDEFISRSRTVFEDTAIYGLLYPMMPTRETFKRKQWARSTVVGDFEKNINRAWYSMYTVASIAMLTTSGLSATSGSIAIPVSYRGAPVDYALFADLDRQGNKFEPLFRIVSKTAYYELTDPTSKRYHYRWYVEEPDTAVVSIPGMDSKNKLPPGGVFGGPLSFPPPDFANPSGISGPPVHDGSDSSSDSDSGSSKQPPVINPPPMRKVLTSSDLVGVSHKIPPLTRKQKRELDKQQIGLQSIELSTDASKGSDTSKSSEVEDYLTSDERSKMPPVIENKDSGALEFMLARAENFRDRGDFYRQAVLIESLHMYGVDKKYTQAFASLMLTPVSDSQARPEIDIVYEMDVFDVLLALDKGKRQAAVKDICKSLLAILRNVTAGRVFKEITSKYMACGAIELALHSNPAMTAEEYISSCSFRRLQDEGLTTIEGGRRVVATGRLPDQATIKKLISAGQLLTRGSTKRGKKLAAPPEQSVALDSIEDLLRVIISSAWDAGEEPDLMMLTDIAGENFGVAELVESMRAAKTMDERGITSDSLNLCAASGGVPLAQEVSQTVVSPLADCAPAEGNGSTNTVPAVMSGPENDLNSKDSVENAISATQNQSTEESCRGDADASSSESSAVDLSQIATAGFVDPSHGVDGSAN